MDHGGIPCGGHKVRGDPRRSEKLDMRPCSGGRLEAKHEWRWGRGQKASRVVVHGKDGGGRRETVGNLAHHDLGVFLRAPFSRCIVNEL